MKRLERVMRWVYKNYTGQQLAEVIAKLRREMMSEQELADLDARIAKLSKRKKAITESFDDDEE